MKVEFIKGTSAMGSFIIMQCQKTESDYYRPMERNEGPYVISLPYMDSGYKVLVYDLEEDGLPSTLPAITEERVVFNETDPPTGACTVNISFSMMSGYNLLTVETHAQRGLKITVLGLDLCVSLCVCFSQTQ